MRRVAKQLIDKLRPVHFLVAFVVLVPLSAILLRQNNLTMLELRDKVLEVDEATGDISQVEPHLTELGEYVLAHMNTDMGRLELPGTFNTAVAEVQRQVEASGSANANIYAEAQARCEDPSILLAARAQCIQDYVTSNAAPGTDIQFLEFPDKSLYSYSFASPTWSPDLAGFSILLAFLSLVVFMVLFAVRVVAPFIGRVIDNDPLE